MFKHAAFALGGSILLWTVTASGQVKEKDKSGACVSSPATTAKPLRLSTKLGLSHVTKPVLPSWKPAHPLNHPYPIVAFVRVDDCGVVKVTGVRTPHPDFKRVAKDVEAAVTRALGRWKFRPYDHQGHRMAFEFAVPFTVSNGGIDLDSDVRVDTQPAPRS